MKAIGAELRKTILAVALMGVFLTGCSNTPETVRAAVRPESARRPAPAIELKDGNGTAFRLADYKGKVVLVNFWATWCGPCKIEIPWFIEFEQNYKDKGFAVLGISMDEEGWDIVKPYATTTKINYRLAIGDEITAQKYGGVESLPTTYLLDKQGRIAATHVGLVSKKDYQHDIETLLAGK
jgi:thiol-disulfide isomerase/thioredoxin